MRAELLTIRDASARLSPLDRVDFDSFAATFAQIGDVDTLQLVATLNHQLHHRGALYRFRLVTVDPT